MLAGVAQNAEEICIQPVPELWIKTLFFPAFDPIVVYLEKYDYVTLFFDAAMIPCDHHAHVFVSGQDVLHLRNMGRKAASVKHMSRSGMFEGENAVKKIWKHGEEMSY